MKKTVKNITVCVLLIICCGVMSSCFALGQEYVQNTVKIPDIEKLDVGTAKTLLAGKGLIPKVEYEYNNDYDYDLVIRTNPSIGSEVEEDTPVTLYVCKGPLYYELPNAVGYIYNVNNIDPFSWGDDGKPQTKEFYTPYVKEGYLYIPICLKCTSEYNIEFYEDFGTASINDSFDKRVPIQVIYENKTVDNKGGRTDFEVKIPLSDLGVQKPTNVYVEFDFYVNSVREDFEAGFNLTW